MFTLYKGSFLLAMFPRAGLASFFLFAAIHHRSWQWLCGCLLAFLFNLVFHVYGMAVGHKRRVQDVINRLETADGSLIQCPSEALRATVPIELFSQVEVLHQFSIFGKSKRRAKLGLNSPAEVLRAYRIVPASEQVVSLRSYPSPLSTSHVFYYDEPSDPVSRFKLLHEVSHVTAAGALLASTSPINRPAFLAAASLVVLIVGFKWAAVAVVVAYWIRDWRLSSRARIEGEVYADCNALLAMRNPEEARVVAESLTAVWSEEVKSIKARWADPTTFTVDNVDSFWRARKRVIELVGRLKTIRRNVGSAGQQLTMRPMVIFDETSLLLMLSLAWAAWSTKEHFPVVVAWSVFGLHP